MNDAHNSDPLNEAENGGKTNEIKVPSHFVLQGV